MVQSGVGYPMVGFHFRVEFALSSASYDMQFRDVSGLSMELDEESVTEGGENRFIQRLPKRAKYPDLVLKRGMLQDSELREWCRAAIQEMDIQPVTVWVILLNEQHEPLQTYTFINAWPKRWQLSDLNAESSAVVIETLELAYQYFTVN
ncbi:phage tail protein [Corallincola spongiicola]|uniref:Phage tail protein n=1 Tax=Corallincola spongiicola TaxID=2520508 RepID=A0ABY1WUT3_9GAMM|nr:phage tail protein [Corallincola spongiicola]TAA48437.1 phage tail protein [Corallincola spongiicola]